MEKKYSPGPWELTPQRLESGMYEVCSTGGPTMGIRVADVNGPDNACLIAAAPEMYAALDAFFNEDRIHLNDNADILRKMRAAFLKARGE